ncbi:uncharacterized protein LY89DRAFT_418835 [Mollisia scopiformis]|uniref:Uncharacterized protein n=1 Tax=Mollisia scopiformis TaxID=149040 RepID=A0A194XLA3_MOLSC|nr:uncharacterized protein LY89DRAFT_418835 [Mollisia scopiformis]KUJ20911.1 hypothetical protein LY89DRAFT_418835 [Mollisia scopiformis]
MVDLFVCGHPCHAEVRPALLTYPHVARRSFQPLMQLMRKRNLPPPGYFAHHNPPSQDRRGCRIFLHSCALQTSIRSPIIEPVIRVTSSSASNWWCSHAADSSKKEELIASGLAMVPISALLQQGSTALCHGLYHRLPVVQGCEGEGGLV